MPVILMSFSTNGINGSVELGPGDLPQDAFIAIREAVRVSRKSAPAAMRDMLYGLSTLGSSPASICTGYALAPSLLQPGQASSASSSWFQTAGNTVVSL